MYCCRSAGPTQTAGRRAGIKANGLLQVGGNYSIIVCLFILSLKPFRILLRRIVFRPVVCDCKAAPRTIICANIWEKQPRNLWMCACTSPREIGTSRIGAQAGPHSRLPNSNQARTNGLLVEMKGAQEHAAFVAIFLYDAASLACFSV